MKQEDYKSQVERWLQAIDKEALQKIYHVVTVLDLEWQLRDDNIFNLPLQKLLKNSIVSKEELITILTNLQNKGIVLVIRYLGEYPQSDDPDDPGGANWGTIDGTPDIINYSDTQIRLIPPEKFMYLLTQLKRVHNKRQSGEHESTKMEWPADYRWVSDTEYQLGKDKQVKFGSNDSARIKLFRMQAAAKGAYVRVKDMAEEINKTEASVRTILGQINKENLAGKGIAIVSPKDKNKPGAYRIQRTSSL